MTACKIVPRFDILLWRRTLWVLLLLPVQFVRANDSVMVMNTTTGQNTYEVVFQAEKSTTDEKPGIYAINRKGKSIPVILGNILGANRGFNGLLAQTSFRGANQDSAEGIAIVDGKLTVFNKNTSSEDSKKQPIYFGEKGFELFDPNSGLQIKDRVRIANLDDINIKDLGRLALASGSISTTGQLFIASVKHPNTFGQGFTFAFILEQPNTVDSTAKIFKQTAYVISYDFMDEAGIEKIREANLKNGAQAQHIFSPNYATALIQKYRSQSENPLIAQWLKHLESRLSFIHSSKKISKEPGVVGNGTDGLPFFDIFTQQTIFFSIPAVSLSSDEKDELKLYQAFDPRNDSWIVLDQTVFARTETTNEQKKLSFVPLHTYGQKQSQAIAGKVNYDDRGKYKMTALDPKNKSIGEQEYLVMVGDASIFLLRSKFDNTLKSVSIANFRVSEYRSLDVLHLKQTTASNDDSMFHYLLVSMTSKTGKKTLTAIGLKETIGAGFVQVFAEEVVGAHISREEMQLRSKLIADPTNYGLYFDTEKPYLGAASYQKRLLAANKEKSEEAHENNDVVDVASASVMSRLTKYQFLPQIKTTSGLSAYLRAAKAETAISGGVLTFLQFGDKNIETADLRQTGFYIDPSTHLGKINDGVLSLEKPLFAMGSKHFVPGRPIYFQKKKILAPMSLDIANIPLLGRGDVDVAIVPYSSNLKASRGPVGPFKLVIAANGSTSSKTEIPTQVILSEIPAPFESLIGAKIVKGIRTNSNHFHILFFFGKDQSATAGVYSISGLADISFRNGEPVLEFKTTNSGTWLTKELINPSELSLRLKADATGNYYWLDNPQEPIDSLKLRVRDLMNPNSFLYVNKESDSRKRIQLRFEEEVGSEKGASDLYAKWQLMTRYELNSRYPWFKQYIESIEAQIKNKDGKKNKSSPYEDDYSYSASSSYISDDRIVAAHDSSSVHFTDFLESLARSKEAVLAGDETRKPKRQILLVEERMKKAFLNDVMMQLYGKGKNFSLRLDKKGKFYFYGYDVTSTLEEGQKEMKSISDTSVRSDVVFFSTLEDISGASPLVQDESKSFQVADSTAEEDGTSNDNEKEVDNGDQEKKLSRWLFLATEGKKSDLAALRRRVVSETAQIPTLIIGTPKELADAKKQNPEAVAAGVFDAFEINNEFLTSSWMLWAPGSKHSTPKVNEYSQMSISDEEHKVFPEIDRIFSQAANGEIIGKQKVLIVSKELKPLINRLIMGRWASDSAIGLSPWNYSNDHLLLYSLQDDKSANSQDKVFENFQAMRGGARYKNVVFYADLENVNGIGRPFNPTGANFKLKDPVMAGMSRKDFISIDEAGPNKEENELTNNTEISALTNEREALENQIQQYEQQMPQVPDENNRQRYQLEISNLQSKIKVLDNKIATFMTDVNTGDNQAMPHLMWLIAAEGEKIQPKAGRDWSITSAVDRKITTVLIATPEEWAMAEHDLSFEAKYFDPKEHFEFEELSSPSEEIKVNLVRSLFLKPEIQSMDYRFSISDNSNEDAERQLIAHFVNRVEQIAIQQNMESTTAFIKAFAELRRTLVEDTSLRRSRTIDKNFLERLFFKIFPLPISLENLETDDPLNRLQNIQEAARKLQQLGYHGAMDLKERTLETILNQTRGGDAGRPIPNSQIYFGGTSSGKTFLFKKKVEMLGLTAYNPNKINNEEADYLIISVQNLVEEGSKEAGKLTVDDAIEMIQDLIAQPKGHRSFILFDDAHKTSSKVVHQKLFSFIQSLFEAPNGVIRVKKKGTKEFKEVPVQNLNLYMTVNPTANKQQKEKYADGTNLNRLVLAALANHGVDMEESMLARWSDIINLDQFPRGAKVPALVERVRKASASTTATVLVDSKVIDALVERYPSENAREFLSPAASALTRIPPAAEKSSIYIVTKRTDVPTEKWQSSQHRSGGFLTSTELNQTVKELTQVEPVLVDQPTSLAKLVEFLMGNFRMQVFNHTILSAQNTEILRLNSPGQSTLLQRNFILSAMTHILKNPSLPIQELRIAGEDFSYLGEAQVQELVEIVAHRAESQTTSYFPFDVDSKETISPLGSLSLVGISPDVEDSEHTRSYVMRGTVLEIEKVFKKMFRLYTRFPNGDLRQTLSWNRDDIVQWYENLPSKDTVEEYRELTQSLVLIYKKFIEDFNDENLVELRGAQTTDLSIYDHGRIFSYLVDKALTRLPWGLMSKFVLDVMNEAGDLSLGQKPNFINYAYHHEISPLAIVTSDFLNETFAAEVKDKAKVEKLDSEFKNRCEVALTAKGTVP